MAKIEIDIKDYELMNWVIRPFSLRIQEIIPSPLGDKAVIEGTKENIIKWLELEHCLEDPEGLKELKGNIFELSCQRLV